MYAIMGITGHVGGVAARELLRQGHSLRALVRDVKKAASWAEQGVELVEGDFTDEDAVARVLSGAEAAFLMLPPFMAPAVGYPEAKAIIASYVEALQHVKPERLVVLSSIGSEQSRDLGLITATHLLEQALSHVTIPTVFVRAASFLENYLSSARVAAELGVFNTLWTPEERAFPMIASEDIGVEIARRLVERFSETKIVELGTPASPNDLARAMSEAFGRPVVARSTPRDKWTSVLEAARFAPRGIEAYSEMVDSCNSGWIGFGVEGTEAVAATTTLTNFFATNVKAVSTH